MVEIKESLKWTLKIAFIAFTASGFMMFVLEESLQMMSFGEFAYSSAKDWNGMEEHLKLHQNAHDFASFMINAFGWMNPLMYPAYLQYLEADKAYIKAAYSRVRAKS